MSGRRRLRNFRFANEGHLGLLRGTFCGIPVAGSIDRWWSTGRGIACWFNAEVTSVSLCNSTAVECCIHWWSKDSGVRMVRVSLEEKHSKHH